MNEELPLCACGCGQLVAKKGNRFIFGHNRRGKKHSSESLDKMSKSHKNYYKNNPEVLDKMSKQQKENPSCGFLGKHHSQESIDKISKAKAGKSGTPHTEKAKIAISNGLKDKPKSQKHRKKLSESVKNSDAHKIASENQIGGNDIIKHHIAYDFNRMETLIVEITRKFHGMIHSPKGIKRHIRGYSLID